MSRYESLWMSPNAVAGFAIVVALVVLRASPAGAAGGLDITPSAATAGRGGAGTAVFWSADLDDWANPALLGYMQGLDYRWSRTRLVPDLASDVYFRTDRLALGGGGIGLNLASTTVDYGVIALSDNSGTFVGTFRPTETADPIGAGLSLSRLIGSLSALRGGAPPMISRYGDFAVGFTTKDVRITLAPPSFPGGTGSAHTRDFGFLLRVNPVPRTDAGHRFVEMAYGYASLNGSDAGISFIDQGSPTPVGWQHRNGVAIRVGFPLHLASPRGLAGWIVRGMDPYLTVSVAADHVHHHDYYYEYSNYDVDAVGAEIDLAGVVTARLGHVTDRAGEIDAFSFGGGIALPLARFMGLRYDFASYPEATGLSSIHRHGIGVWFDPFALRGR